MRQYAALAPTSKDKLACANSLSSARDVRPRWTIYTDEILRDVLTRGVADPEIQLDLLSDSNQNMTLENVF